MPAKVKRRPAALKKSTAKSAAKKSKSASDDEPRKSRVGFKNVGMLAESLSPFVEKRFFSNYTTDRAIKSMDKKKLCSSYTGMSVSTAFWSFLG